MRIRVRQIRDGDVFSIPDEPGDLEYRAVGDPKESMYAGRLDVEYVRFGQSADITRRLIVVKPEDEIDLICNVRQKTSYTVQVQHDLDGKWRTHLGEIKTLETAQKLVEEFREEWPGNKFRILEGTKVFIMKVLED